MGLMQAHIDWQSNKLKVITVKLDDVNKTLGEKFDEMDEMIRNVGKVVDREEGMLKDVLGFSRSLKGILKNQGTLWETLKEVRDMCVAAVQDVSGCDSNGDEENQMEVDGTAEPGPAPRSIGTAPGSAGMAPGSVEAAPLPTVTGSGLTAPLPTVPVPSAAPGSVVPVPSAALGSVVPVPVPNSNTVTGPSTAIPVVSTTAREPSPNVTMTTPTPINSQDDAQETTSLVGCAGGPTSPNPLPHSPNVEGSSVQPVLPSSNNPLSDLPPASEPSTHLPPDDLSNDRTVDHLSPEDAIGKGKRSRGKPATTRDRRSPRIRGNSSAPSPPNEGGSKRSPDEDKGGDPKRRKVVPT
jgi:hypothetical protein